MKRMYKRCLSSPVLSKNYSCSFAEIHRKIFKTSEISNSNIFDYHISQSQARSDMLPFRKFKQKN